MKSAQPAAFVKRVGLAIVLLALSTSSLAERFSVPSCDQLIDASYNQLSNSEKAAKLAKYGGCWKSKADQHLQKEYRKAKSELRNWAGNARIQAQEQVREFGDTATGQMTARHKDETSALNHEFDSQISVLQLSSGEATSAEINEHRKEISQERREARTELQDQHRDERDELAKDIRDSKAKVNQFIDDAVRAEEESLLRQLVQKLAYIKRELQAVVRGPMSGSVNEGFQMAPEQTIGEIRDLTGQATVTRTDGTSVPAQTGLEIYQGDIVETGEATETTIHFVDETTFPISGNARLAIDEYIYDPETEESTRNFSILRGLFVFTSGLISRDDPEEIEVDTPVGSIGIRG